ncbi:hypothetical protein H0H81_004416 [Sphagnurus paluster]|uniref:Uncharacterized protein n=1 Tax=Sphagnurus paluster TaxID=117069 RepID=A0A9P7FMX5_9AGAR|nr:hypothetical protein H0H81_004416 [Sphagnurus paluster]
MHASQKKLEQARKQLARLEDTTSSRVTRRSASNTESTQAQQIMKKKSEIAALEVECAAVVQPNLCSKRTVSPAEHSETSKKGRLEEENLSDLSDLSDDEGRTLNPLEAPEKSAIVNIIAHSDGASQPFTTREPAHDTCPDANQEYLTISNPSSNSPDAHHGPFGVSELNSPGADPLSFDTSGGYNASSVSRPPMTISVPGAAIADVDPKIVGGGQPSVVPGDVHYIGLGPQSMPFPVTVDARCVAGADLKVVIYTPALGLQLLSNDALSKPRDSIGMEAHSEPITLTPSQNSVPDAMKSKSAVASLIHPGNNVSLGSAITLGKLLVLDDSPKVSIKKGKKKAVTKATKSSDVKYVNTNAPTIKPYEEWDSHEELNKEIDKHLICYVHDQMARKKSQEENPNSIQPETRVQLPPGLRKMIRELRGVAPNAATTTRELALHILTSSHLNTKCLHHGFDRRAKPSSTVIGNQSDPATPAAGLLNCGCNEEDALWDFFSGRLPKVPVIFCLKNTASPIPFGHTSKISVQNMVLNWMITTPGTSIRRISTQSAQR